jgi:hypothetical protein
MRNVTWMALLALVLAGVPAGAAPFPIGGGPGPHVATDNVEWLGNIPLNAGSAGARVLVDHLYITEDRGLTIWDISDPADPQHVGFTPVPQAPYVTEEDPDTNGEVLLISSYTDSTRGIGPLSRLFVVDVSDKSAPYIRSEVLSAQQHTWSCVLDCTWGYGSNGVIADLRDLDAPLRSEVSWLTVVREQLVALDLPMRANPHDVTEVADGFVMVSSNPVVLLDVREDPEAPKVVAVGELPDGRFIHGNLWPNDAADDLLLVGGETVGDCSSETSGAFMTFDASGVDLTDEDALADGVPAPLELLDEHRVFTGVYTDGDSPYNQFCAHWFTEHPTFDGAGLVAMGWYEHGVRFLEVAADGAIEEVGYWVPLGGSTSAAYWVDEEIVYTADYQRGIDILRFTGEAPTDEVRVDGPAPAAPLARPRVQGALQAAGVLPPYCPIPGL